MGDKQKATSSSFDAKGFLNKHKKFATPERMAILKKLCKITWFQNSDQTVQDDLATLPQDGKINHDGFLRSLIGRPDQIGETIVLNMVDLARGYYTLCPIFEIQNIYTKKIYTYEYAAMWWGVPAGVKGLLLVRPHKDAKPTHFVVLSAQKFATGKKGYDLMGGRAEHQDEDGEQSAHVNNAIREIREEVGVMDLHIDSVEIFGSHSVDSGITSHETVLFAAYISTQESKRISTHAKNIDDYEMNTYVEFIPLKDLNTFIKKCSSALVLGAIAKAQAHGLLET